MRKASLLVLLFLVLMVSCNKNKNKTIQETEELSKTKTTVQLYYFSQKPLDNTTEHLHNISSINKCPKCDFLPWTESTRISGMGFFDGEACFIVNKVGIFPFSSIFNQSVTIFSNSLFPFFTASGFYNTDIGFLVKSYKNTMFESIGNFEEDKLTHEELPILNRYNPITKDLESILFPHHFALPAYASLTELSYNTQWLASFKLDDGKNIQFRYFKFNNINDILNANYTPITADVFMEAMLPILEDGARFSSLPEPIISLIKSMEEKSVSIEYFDSNYPSPIKIIRNTGKANNFEVSEYEAVAFSNRTKDSVVYALLLNNGKLYIYETKTKDIHIYSLPKLPKDFSYTYFTLQDNIVLAGWEEKDFFECGRTGLITAPIEKLKKL
ncbi:MAG: hypothetical protein ACTTKH_03040 [Treponema sp.]